MEVSAREKEKGGCPVYAVVGEAKRFLFLCVCVCCFRGAGPGCNTQEIGEKLARLRSEVSALESLESNLDQHKQVIENCDTRL